MSTQIDLLKKYGLPIKGLSGQHLLIDGNVQRKIVEALKVKPGDKVLEIGPGLGALTGHLLKAGAQVTAIEKDPRFIDILEGEWGCDYPAQLKVIHKDVLKVDLPKIFSGETSWKVISNLPYYITAPILFTLLAYRGNIDCAVLMMQKEVATRLSAIPGNKDYGRLTLGVRFAADAKNLFDIPPECFTPKPKVNSSVVELSFHTNSRLPEELEEALFFHVVKVAFSQRRKTLLGLLAQDQKMSLKKEDLLEVFKKLEFDSKIRGESLLLKDYVALCSEIQHFFPVSFSQLPLQ